MKILHIIHRDKFTSGYVNFMKIKFIGYEHFFITSELGFSLDFIDNKNIFYYTKSEDFIFRFRRLIRRCDKVIISGLFDASVILALFFYDAEIWSKVYLQFWGGDFYQFRGDSAPEERRTIFYEAVLNCGGIITLIDEVHSNYTIIFHRGKNDSLLL